MTRVFATALLALAAACGRGPAPSGAVGTTASASASGAPSAPSIAALGPAAPAPMDAREAGLWARAKDGEGDDVARLADYEGSAGLVERASSPDLRATAIRAAGDCRDFGALPWLASVAADVDDESAMAALDSVAELASQRRRSVDPEDASELRDGCDRLLALAKDTGRARPRRVVAIRALRMLVDRGCVDATQIPTDVDAK